MLRIYKATVSVHLCCRRRLHASLSPGLLLLVRVISDLRADSVVDPCHQCQDPMYRCLILSGAKVIHNLCRMLTEGMVKAKIKQKYL